MTSSINSNYNTSLSDTSEREFRDINICDLNRKIGELKDTSFDKIEKAIEELEGEYHFKNVNPKLSTLAGCPKDIQAFFSHSASLQTWERHSLYAMIKNSTHWEEFLEILTKALIYREMKEGIIVPVPNFSDTPKIEYFIVEKTIVTGKGFTANLLLPVSSQSTLPPILVCSGSNFHFSGLDALSCYISDMEYELGSEAYASAESELYKVMKNAPEGLIVTGHSLGGNLAQQIAAHYPEKVERLVTYNSPGVSERIHQTFRENSENLTKPLKIDIYQSSADIVDAAGGLHLGYKSEQATLSLTRFILGDPLTTFTHTYLCLSNPCGLKMIFELFGDAPLSKISTEHEYRVYDKKEIGAMNPFLDNVGRDILEFLRKTLGGGLITPSLRAIRWVVRLIVGSRATSSLAQREEDFK